MLGPTITCVLAATVTKETIFVFGPNWSRGSSEAVSGYPGAVQFELDRTWRGDRRSFGCDRQVNSVRGCAGFPGPCDLTPTPHRRHRRGEAHTVSEQR
jgi:hypothetical protein